MQISIEVPSDKELTAQALKDLYSYYKYNAKEYLVSGAEWRKQKSVEIMNQIVKLQSALKESEV